MAFFNFSQFISLTVRPAEIPSICVCTAPATPTVHKSLLLALICGEIAEGGGLLMVVSIFPSDITVLSDLIVSSAANALPIKINKPINIVRNMLHFH
ncbi:hypothetical protein OAQ98_03135 [Alphaproteobacteria bacterium]|nr:hypothetical protein [Alphaproteobacteria bacterium]